MSDIRKLNREQMTQLYEEHIVCDFPKAELKPLEYLLEKMDAGEYEGLGWFEAGELCAYALFLKEKTRDYLLDYLAVCRGFRSGGMGSRFLQAFLDFYRNQTKGKMADPCPGRLYFECESIESAASQEEKDLRARRIGFYLRNGAEATRVFSQLFGVEYQIFWFSLGQEAGGAKAEAAKAEAAKTGLQGSGSENADSAGIREDLERIYRQMFPEKLMKYISVEIRE